MNTYIKAYAFDTNWKSIASERSKRYEEIKDAGVVRIDSCKVSYAENLYYGEVLNKEVTPLDILLICDNGNTCFGGTVDINGDRFWATVFTD